jgi:Na+/H+-dicarboxylate symporter
MYSKTKENSMAVRLIIGIAVGAVVGYAYYRFVGCSRGSCPLTGNPFISTIYGAFLGALISSSIFRK